MKGSGEISQFIERPPILYPRQIRGRLHRGRGAGRTPISNAARSPILMRQSIYIFPMEWQGRGKRPRLMKDYHELVNAVSPKWNAYGGPIFHLFESTFVELPLTRDYSEYMDFNKTAPFCLHWRSKVCSLFKPVENKRSRMMGDTTNMAEGGGRGGGVNELMK